MIAPADFVVRSAEGQVNYGASLQSIPSFGISVSTPKILIGDFSVSLLGKIGYGHRSGLYPWSDSMSGVRYDHIHLQWMPFLLSGRFHWGAPESIVRPWVIGGVGLHWLRQTGDATPLKEAFWVPEGHVGAGFTFFEPTPGDDSDFIGGFHFGLLRHFDLDARQSMHYWSFDLSLSFLI